LLLNGCTNYNFAGLDLLSGCISSEDLDEMNVEVMRATLYKAYLEDFAALCRKLGGGTETLMGDLLAFEADRRAVAITINSLGTELGRDDRRKLFPTLGALCPYGHAELMAADDMEGVRAAVEKYPTYGAIFAKVPFGSDATALDKAFYEEEVKRHNKPDDCWVILNGKVYDVTEARQQLCLIWPRCVDACSLGADALLLSVTSLTQFMEDHPGGKKVILAYAGRDASEEFNALHSAFPECSRHLRHLHC
jgi:cytochrome b involved in lipid metabolism